MPSYFSILKPAAIYLWGQLPPVPGFEPIVEIQDEEYVLVDHDAYEGATTHLEVKPQPPSTDEILASNAEASAAREQTVRARLGLENEKAKRSVTEMEKKVGELMHRVDKEICDEENEEWRWLCNADLKNRSIWVYKKRRLVLENRLRVTAEKKHFLPLGGDTAKLDGELQVLDMARRMLDKRFEEKWGYTPPVEMWMPVQEERDERATVAAQAVFKGVVSAAYGVVIPF